MTSIPVRLYVEKIWAVPHKILLVQITVNLINNKISCLDEIVSVSWIKQYSIIIGIGYFNVIKKNNTGPRRMQILT